MSEILAILGEMNKEKYVHSILLEVRVLHLFLKLYYFFGEHEKLYRGKL